MRLTAWAIALGLLAAPLALAESVSGRLLIKGGILLPPRAVLDLDERALFAPSTSTVVALFGTIHDATIHVYREELADATVLDQRPSVRLAEEHPSWTASRLNITLENGPHEGWLGIHPGAAARVHATLDAPTTVTPAAGADIGNSPWIPDEASPDRPVYHASIRSQQLLAEPSSWKHTGAGMLKLSGLALRLESETNVTIVETAPTHEEGPPAKSVNRWLAIEFESGELSMEGASTQIAADRGTASWNGIAATDSANGILRGENHEYSDTGGAATLDGDLFATIVPTASSSDASLALDLSGDLADSTLLTRAAHPRTVEATWLAWLPVILLGAVGGAGGFLYLQRHRGPRSEHLSAEEYAKLAEMAASAERYDEAAAWLERARHKAPSSKRLVVEHAYVLAKGGRRDAALVALGGADGDDPDAALLQARLLAEEEREDEAAAATIRALNGAPALLLDVEEDPALARVRIRDDVREAIRRARRALR